MSGARAGCPSERTPSGTLPGRDLGRVPCRRRGNRRGARPSVRGPHIAPPSSRFEPAACSSLDHATRFLLPIGTFTFPDPLAGDLPSRRQDFFGKEGGLVLKASY